jgi:DNA-binding PadR family transcriptional regulator
MNLITAHLERGIFRAYVLWMCSQKERCGDDFIHLETEHGHTLSPGKLYPILKELTDAGFLEVQIKKEHGKMHKYYKTTKKGLNALNESKNELGLPMKMFIRTWLSD